jgi:hypothetical protein
MRKMPIVMAHDQPGPVKLLAAAFGLAASLVFTGPAAAATAVDPLPTESGGAYAVHVISWRDLPFRTVVRQQFDYSCGSAALATLMRFHYGQSSIREAEIFTTMYKAGDQAKIRKVGFSLLDMKRYLEGKGYHADGYQLPLADFATMNTPGIALIQTGPYRHFVVVKGVRGSYVLVGDPALGLKIYSKAAFQKVWSGIIFVIDDNHAGQFNVASEWAQRPIPSMAPYFVEQSPGQLMRNLPTLYQISTVENLPYLPPN